MAIGGQRIGAVGACAVGCIVEQIAGASVADAKVALRLGCSADAAVAKGRRRVEIPRAVGAAVLKGAEICIVGYVRVGRRTGRRGWGSWGWRGTDLRGGCGTADAETPISDTREVGGVGAWMANARYWRCAIGLARTIEAVIDTHNAAAAVAKVALGEISIRQEVIVRAALVALADVAVV